ncbi:MAG: ABC transporter substrate-binding protein [Acetobacteraceae bacterium]
MKIQQAGIRRRHVLGAAAALPLVHIRSAGAAGTLSVGFWDHWVPKGNEVMRAQVNTWAEKNKVDVQIDFITSVGNKLLLTGAAEAQAKSGHDLMTFRDWEAQNHAETLEPVDDLMKTLIDKHGQVNDVSTYLGKYKGQWRGIPTTSGSNYKGPVARISVLKEKAGLDVQAMYPAEPRQTREADAWTWDAHLKAAEACFKAGMPFGIGLGTTVDSVDTAGALFRAFGAELVNAKGDIMVDSDQVRQALEHAQQLVKFLPNDAVSYDDASNNRALISGRAALIWNPPSAWAVAKRDAPKIAEDCWSFPAPKGPAGRYTPAGPWFWGIWSFAKNKSAAKDLVLYLMDRPQSEARSVATEGFDVSPFASMLDFKIWEEVGPPKGTLYSYPPRPFHDGIPAIAGAPAPPEIGVQIYSRGVMPTMMAKLKAGQSIPQVIAWAKNEIEGFSR